MTATLDEEELLAFEQSASKLLDRYWPSARAANHGELGPLWIAAAEAGWFGAAASGMLEAVIVTTRALGAVACPLPILDAMAAARLFPAAAGDIAAGAIRPVVAWSRDDGRVRHVEAATAATHAMILNKTTRHAALLPIVGSTPTPGTALPAWSDVAVAAPEHRFVGDGGLFDDVALLRGLGLAARALSAAARSHTLAIDHARTRRQFGRLIGAFGAVQQRSAACQIDIEASSELIDRAVRRFEQNATDWRMSAAIATTHVAAAAPRVQFGAHHTLAASGYFDEHEAPWLFRRVQADVAAIGETGPASGILGDLLVESGCSLPDLEEDPASAGFRAGLRHLLDVRCAGKERHGFGAPDQDVVDVLVEGNLLGMGWPASWGGREASPAEQTVLLEELQYRRLAVWQATGAVHLLGAAILRHGTEAQKTRFLPMIRAGKLRFCLGYSESEAGSDLASLRTCAFRDGDTWIIDGQKIWTSGADHSDWIWLATRTDPSALPPQSGITIFLLPMNSPGISVTPHRAMSGEISCTVTFEQVKVPDTARIGEVGGGWSVIVQALAGERVSMGSAAAALHRQFDELLGAVRAQPARAGSRGSAVRATLARLAAAIQATRVMVARGQAASEGSSAARLDAPIAKVMGGEVAEELARAAVEILGPDALLGTGVPCVPGDGWFDYGLRLSPMYVIGGGTNDILRGEIARSLGLPRW